MHTKALLLILSPGLHPEKQMPASDQSIGHERGARGLSKCFPRHLLFIIATRGFEEQIFKT